jgi:phage baseplate assembly protein W
MFNKDIKLEKINDGEYDRVFYVNDYETVEGLESVKNSIIISLMTRSGELNNNPTYNSFGCSAWNHLKQNNIPLTQLTIQKSIKTSLNKIKQVKNVDHIQIETKPNKPHTMNVFFTLTLDNNIKFTDGIKLGDI